MNAEWRPKESLPRDGSEVIAAYKSHKGIKRLAIVHWIADGWYAGSMRNSGQRVFIENIYKWMPAPAVPDDN
jgi:hypothetical protein